MLYYSVAPSCSPGSDVPACRFIGRALGQIQTVLFTDSSLKGFRDSPAGPAAGLRHSEIAPSARLCAPGPRRPARLTHFCSDRVTRRTRPRCTPQVEGRDAISSPPQAGCLSQVS